MFNSKIAILLAIFMLSLPVRAEDMSYLLNSTPAQRAAAQSRFMHNKLGLSAQKQSEVEAINLEFAEKVEPILKGSNNIFAKIYDLKNIQEQKELVLKRVFDQQQFQLYSDLKDELKEAVKAELSH